VTLASAGCAALRPSPATTGGQELIGLTARLSARSGPALSLAVDGTASGRPAVIRMDLASPLSRATPGCFPQAPPKSHGTVRFRRPWGAPAELPEAWLDGVEIGGRRLQKRLVAVEQGQGCDVWLGADALASMAMEVDPPAGTVTFTASRPRSSYGAGAIDLDRDPTTDRLLLPVRLRFGDVELSAPFLLSTAEPRSTLSGVVAGTAGLPDADAYGPSLLALAPGASLRFATLLTRRDWTSTAAAGELGADVWGRFKLRIDPAALALMLVRPTTIEEGGRSTCASSKEPSCLTLHAERTGDRGWRVSFTAARDLPEGAVAWLDLQRGTETLPCRAALSLWPSDRGTSLAVDLPSPGLREAGCDADLQAATALTPAAVDESGPEIACPGECLLLQQGRGGDLTCQCSTFGTLREPPARGNVMPEEHLPPEPEPQDPGP
jgi:hypothetical protein